MLPRLVLVLVVAGLCSRARADAPSSSIKGTVIFEGEPPQAAKQPRDVDPKCPQNVDDDAVVVDHGKLRDVLVRVKNHTIGPFDAPKDPVVIDQRGCSYSPRVVGLVAGQQLLVRNSDRTFHNVWGQLRGKDLWNKPQAPNADALGLDPSAAKADDVVELKCGVHAWMHGYVAVQDHPFFAVTDGKGAFEIDNLPAGTYTLEAWHPTLGTRTLTVKIGKAKLAFVNARFSYKASDVGTDAN
jgi:hypothetical protein